MYIYAEGLTLIPLVSLYTLVVFVVVACCSGTFSRVLLADLFSCGVIRGFGATWDAAHRAVSQGGLGGEDDSYVYERRSSVQWIGRL